MAENLILKSTQDGLIIEVRREVRFQTVMDELCSLIRGNSKFFCSSAKPAIFIGRDYTPREKKEITRFIYGESGIKDVRFASDYFSLAAKNNELKKDVFLFENVKSGKRLRSDGDIVVVGDVDKGAELIAAGNIIVLGSLMGEVAAGAFGNKDACVAALFMKPVRVRIADKTGALAKDRVSDYAEAIVLEDERLVIRKAGNLGRTA